MAELSEKEIEILNREIEKQGLTYTQLQNELLDHLCCDIEARMEEGVEFLNRFECYFLNCAADGAKFVRAVDHPNCGMMYDTFHAHIEEKNIPRAINKLKDCLVHVHISENDRSTPGKGGIRWPQNFRTLQQIGYDNLMVALRPLISIIMPVYNPLPRHLRAALESVVKQVYLDEKIENYIVDIVMATREPARYGL